MSTRTWKLGQREISFRCFMMGLLGSQVMGISSAAVKMTTCVACLCPSSWFTYWVEWSSSWPMALWWVSSVTDYLITLQTICTESQNHCNNDILGYLFSIPREPMLALCTHMLWLHPWLYPIRQLVTWPASFGLPLLLDACYPYPSPTASSLSDCWWSTW